MGKVLHLALESEERESEEEEQRWFADTTLSPLSLKVLDSIKDIITEGNFDCSPNGLSLQAMDSSHVSLIDILLESEGFEHYRCDRNIPMGEFSRSTGSAPSLSLPITLLLEEEASADSFSFLCFSRAQV